MKVLMNIKFTKFYRQNYKFQSMRVANVIPSSWEMFTKLVFYNKSFKKIKYNFYEYISQIKIVHNYYDGTTKHLF